MKQETRTLWGVVLAAGEGKRLASLTRVLYGRTLPKQFLAFAGERTFLQQTMDRIGPLLPPERTVVVVSAARERLAREQLAGFPGVEIILQPADCGTGPGIVLPIAHILARDPSADIVIFPSDHSVRRPQAFLAAIRRAHSSCHLSPSRIVLVGATADRAATDLGWIEPVPGPGRPEGLRLVRRFVEKPQEQTAWELLRAGALWNTLIVAGSAVALWRMAAEAMPAQVEALGHYGELLGTPEAAHVLERIYAELPYADFSGAVLQRAAGLAVVPMIDAGWSDCGTPERLVASFAGTRGFDALRLQLQTAGVL